MIPRWRVLCRLNRSAGPALALLVDMELIPPCPAPGRSRAAGAFVS